MSRGLSKMTPKTNRFSIAALVLVAGAAVTVAPAHAACSGGTRVTSGLTDASSGVCFVLWDSPTVGTKTEDLPVCGSTNAWITETVTDEALTAGANPIILVPAGPTASTPQNTINNFVTFTLTTNGQSVSLVCDGVSNWAVY